MSELTRDIRCYLTNAGRQAELEALKNGTELEIVSMVIDSALLPDDQDPRNLTSVIAPVGDAYPLMASIDRGKGKITFISDIPSSAGMFTINGFAWVTNTGVLYAYARGLGDVKRPAESGQNDVLRIEAEMLTENAAVIKHTYDDSQIYATHFDLNELVRLHIAASDPHRQYEQKINAATNADIDAGSTAAKHIKLPQLWRAFLNKVKPASLLIAGIVQLSNKYNGTSQTKATTEKALTDGLKTKSNAVHKHSASDINAGTLAKERLPDASTTAKGASQLNDTVTSTSKTQSLTANMGRYIWAKAVEARDLAASKMTQATADGRYLHGQKVVGLSGASSWHKMMTVVMPNSASTIKLTIDGGNGFNVGVFGQLGSQIIHLRTGNGSPSTGLNILSFRDGGLDPIIVDMGYKHISGSTYEVYAKTSNYPNAGLIWNLISSNNASATWNNNTLGVSEPSGMSKWGGSAANYNTRSKPTKSDVNLDLVVNAEQTSAVNDSSKTTYAVAYAVKTAYDKGVSAYNLAASKMTQATADGRYLGKTAKAADSTKVDGKTYSQLYTAIRSGLSPNTNTWRSISDAVNNTSSDISASLKAVKTAYDKGVSAYNLAASKMTQATADGHYLGKTAKAADSAKVDGKTYSQLYTAIRSGLSPDTNTWRSISDVVNSGSSDISASLKAVKTAYDKGVSAYNLAASKMTQATADGRYLHGQKVVGLSGASSWHKMMTVVMPNSASTIKLTIDGGNGFNVGVFGQLGSQIIHLRTGNGSPSTGLDILSFRDGGLDPIIVDMGYKHISGSTYEVYAKTSNYPNAGLIWNLISSNNANATWNNNTLGVSEPSGMSKWGDGVVNYNSRHKPTPEDIGAAPASKGKEWVKVKSGTCSYGVANSGSGYFRGTLDTGLTAPSREFDSGRYRIKFFTDGIISKPSSTPSSSVSWGFYGIIKNITRWNGPHTVCADVYGYGTGLAGGVTNRWELWELQ